MSFVLRALVRTALVVAAIAMSPLAAAQGASEPVGATRPAAIVDKGDYSGAKARLVMDGFARCVLARHRIAVVRAIALPPMSLDETKALAKLVDDNCLQGGQMNFMSFHLRGALYAALYRERFGAGPRALKADAVDFTGGVTPEPESPTARAVAMRQFVDCAVRRRPDAAHRIVVGTAGSGEENVGFSALVTDLTACVAKESQVRFRKSELEGLIAEVLYLDTAAAAPREAGK